jgi:G8 domain
VKEFSLRKHRFHLVAIKVWISLIALTSVVSPLLADESGLIRSQKSGPWSSPSTWETGVVPSAEARVQVRSDHVVLYDLQSDQVIRSIHVSGTLRFATDQNTRLDVGLIKIQPGDDSSENGFDCDDHPTIQSPEQPVSALEVGSAERPIEAGKIALIRLVALKGMNRESTPAIVCCGGRMDFHGAAMSRTWVKLGNDTQQGDKVVHLAEAVAGWSEGDRILVTTATNRVRKQGATLRPGNGSLPRFTEERFIRSIDGTELTLDRPLAETHSMPEGLRAEIANLSRNVIIESADASQGRGHTMYHRHSTGSIGYAEFRHLGKEGVKGRYPIHFHLVGQTMRGSSVIGASVWDSGNRWITIHGTNELVVRDCVGYQSVGHGFFLEDGTETLNVLDRNLAVQAYAGKRLPEQALAFDDNSGAGFWWANSLNTFRRNVAVECDRYGFRYEAIISPADDLRKKVLQTSGRRETSDIRSLSFVQFLDNEAHAQLFGIDLGEGSNGVGPDRDHPFVLLKTRLWDCTWALRTEVPNMLVDGLSIDRCRYGVSHTLDGFRAYRNTTIRRCYLAGDVPTPDDSADEKQLKCDDSSPSTIVTFVASPKNGQRLVRGTSTDDGEIRRVMVNGCEARAIAPGFTEWEITIDDPEDGIISAGAEDVAGNLETDLHRVRVGLPSIK